MLRASSRACLYLVGAGSYSGADAQRLDAEVQRQERQGDDPRASALPFKPLERQGSTASLSGPPPYLAMKNGTFQALGVHMSVTEVLPPREQRKLLVLDGGGIRGLIAVETLAALEAHYRDLRGNVDLRPADEFDYVAGTSTGAVIATCVSRSG